MIERSPTTKREHAKTRRRANRIWRPAARLCFVLVCQFVLPASFPAQNISVKTKFQNGDFRLAHRNRAADIFVADDDFKVVRIAAADFAADVEKVSGAKPEIKTEISNFNKTLVVIGTLGKNPLLDDLIETGKLDAAPIREKWESFLIQTIENPFPGVERALVVAGSDRRGTAFGVYEMSQKIGVSPWVWWADVEPEKRESVFISKGHEISGEPSVKYRGIFLNDEDWGLQPWAARTFEPETGDIGPKTYAKIFELLLRLKANACWAAMHEVTKPFNEIPENRRIADDYAIVMGSSHAEPMLRNNVGEWKEAKENYNFVSNEAGVTAYWESRVAENGKFENVYTLGMRGIHDSPIQGTKNQAERISVLERIIAAQRRLLAKHVGENVEEIPQIFCPYKEVLADYRAGLKVPDDVTIVFPDDNFGYIRYFPNAEEQTRRGGFGVYYHISYLGRPLSYLWLNTTPPALIWEEMSKAYENGMRRFWMLNVGDIKPAEIGIEFFLQMAYDARRWRRENTKDFLKIWAQREFGSARAIEIAAVMDKYYRLGFQRKPEHLQWHLPKDAPRKSDFTETEIFERLEDYAGLRRRAEKVDGELPAGKKDAFYELVLYPVRMAAAANERFFAAELAENYRRLRPEEALTWAKRSDAADEEINRETAYFNEKLAGGKWRLMMSPEMSAGQWTSMRATPPKLSLADFESAIGEKKSAVKAKVNEKSAASNSLRKRKSAPFFIESNGVVAMEAENFTRRADKSGFAWQIIEGLGKTGDSVSVFPQKAATFSEISNQSPSLEYDFEISEAGDFEADFHLLPTQPLIAGKGLRFAVSIDGETPQIVVVDKDSDAGSPKWASNILNQTTVGQIRFALRKGRHVLKIYAVETGVVLDKIVLHSGALGTSYFAPRETKRR